MTIVYQGGPYAGQDDYLLPPPRRLGACAARGYYEQTDAIDGEGRVVYEWVPEGRARAQASRASATREDRPRSMDRYRTEQQPRIAYGI